MDSQKLIEDSRLNFFYFYLVIFFSEDQIKRSRRDIDSSDPSNLSSIER